MSSHHFVKDKQEPALVVANGAPLSSEKLTHLLEWNPFVLALDGGLHYLIRNGIKVDMVLGDFDSVQDSLLESNPLISNYLHIEDQTTTDLEKGIQFLISNGHKAANIINATGNRLDHTMNNIHSLIAFKNDSIDLVIHDDYSKAFLLKPSFKKHLPKGSKISLIPLSPCEQVTTKGLKYNLNQETLNTGIRSGSSNTVIEDGIVEVQHKSGHLLWVESND